MVVQSCDLGAILSLWLSILYSKDLEYFHVLHVASGYGIAAKQVLAPVFSHPALKYHTGSSRAVVSGALQGTARRLKANTLLKERACCWLVVCSLFFFLLPLAQLQLGKGVAGKGITLILWKLELATPI